MHKSVTRIQGHTLSTARELELGDAHTSAVKLFEIRIFTLVDVLGCHEETFLHNDNCLHIYGLTPGLI